jgi:hypothetical protein
MLAAPSAVYAQVGISVQIAPPMLPVYAQPPLPEFGYIWTPGYWAYGDAGYFWVPGTWVAPPQIGYLWTPGYWGVVDSAYIWNEGYWGPHVGFYGGINYGFGYGGNGYQGGRWNNGAFAYNRAANNFGGVHVASTAVFNVPLAVHASARVSFNGGAGGSRARPTAAEETAAHESHSAPTSEQAQHIAAARSNTVQSAAQNHGTPPIAATSRAGQFTGPGVVGARAAPQANVGHANTAVQHTPTAQRTQPVQAATSATNHAATPRPAVHATQQGQPVHAAQQRPAPAAHPVAQAAALRPAPAAPHPQAVQHAAPPAAHDDAPAASHDDDHR